MLAAARLLVGEIRVEIAFGNFGRVAIIKHGGVA